MNRVGSASLWAAVAKIISTVNRRVASVHKHLRRQRSARRLRLSETLSLGEKRFLAVVQFQHQEFLVGGTGQSIALLARLDACEGAQNSTDGIQADGS